jgi:hypothetical protein
LFHCMLYPNNFKLSYISHSSSKRLSFQQFSLHLCKPIPGLYRPFRTKSISSTRGWYENISETRICHICLHLNHSFVPLVALRTDSNQTDFSASSMIVPTFCHPRFEIDVVYVQDFSEKVFCIC